MRHKGGRAGPLYITREEGLTPCNITREEGRIPCNITREEVQIPCNVGDAPISLAMRARRFASRCERRLLKRPLVRTLSDVTPSSAKTTIMARSKILKRFILPRACQRLCCRGGWTLVLVVGCCSA